MHAEAFAFINRVARDITARRLRIVEIGSRDVNGSVRPIFAGHDYTGVDAAPGPGADVVADGAAWGDEAAYDLGLCCETLEHTAEAGAVVANLRRIVRPGGLLILTAAGEGRAPHSAVDGGPVRPGEYYANVTPAMLAAWTAGCPYVNVEVDRRAGDIRAVVRLP